MEKLQKYLLAFPLQTVVDDRVRYYMNQIAKVTGKPAPSKSIEPHISLHKPIVTLTEKEVVDIAAAIARQHEPVTISTGEMQAFGKHYIVLPIASSHNSSALWQQIIHDLLSRLPSDETGEYDTENTLHISLANKTTDIFNEKWETIKKLPITPIEHIRIESIRIYKKPLEGKSKKWQRFKTLPLPNY